jgi:hypothetical protein
MLIEFVIVFLILSIQFISIFKLRVGPYSMKSVWYNKPVRIVKLAKTLKNLLQS